MTKELTKTDQRELHTIAKSINDRQEAIELLKSKVYDTGAQAGIEIVLQGQELIKAKKMVPSGQWQDWIAGHCPRISVRTAQHWMKIAIDPQRVALLKSGVPSRELFGAMVDRSEKNGTDKPAKSCTDYLQTLYLCTRWIKHVRDHPLESCPEETREELRRELHPVVARLWPDKFAVAV